MGRNGIASVAGGLVVAAGLCLVATEAQATCWGCGYGSSGYGYSGGSGNNCCGTLGRPPIGFNYPGYGFPAYRHFMYPRWSGYAYPGYAGYGAGYGAYGYPGSSSYGYPGYGAGGYGASSYGYNSGQISSAPLGNYGSRTAGYAPDPDSAPAYGATAVRDGIPEVQLRAR